MTYMLFFSRDIGIEIPHNKNENPHYSHIYYYVLLFPLRPILFILLVPRQTSLIFGDSHLTRHMMEDGRHLDAGQKLFLLAYFKFIISLLPFPS